MIDVPRTFSILGTSFLILSLVFNIMSTKRFKVPGDIYINRPGLSIYIPWLSSIIVSIILTLIFNFFKK